MPKRKNCKHNWKIMNPEPLAGPTYTRVRWCPKCGCIKLEDMVLNRANSRYAKEKVQYIKPNSYAGSIL